MGGNWAGFDSLSRASDPPGGGVVVLSESCNPLPSTHNLASYAALHYTQSANKYFCRYFQKTDGVGLFVPSTEIPALRAAGFFYLVPISSPSKAREQVNDQSGKDGGRADGQAACLAMVSALNAGQGLVTPVRTYIYLDVEGDVALTNWYWEGWAEGVFNFYDSTYGSPFFPCAYANPDLTVNYAARKQTMDYLSYYAGLVGSPQRCFGLWTQAPNSGSQGDCNNAPPPPYSQALNYGQLTWHHWQYALEGPGCRGWDSCRAWVDNDQSNPTFEMTDYMLRIA